MRWYQAESGFFVYGPDAVEALVVKIAGQVAADESAGAGDDDLDVLVDGGRFVRFPSLGHRSSP